MIDTFSKLYDKYPLVFGAAEIGLHVMSSLNEQDSELDRQASSTNLKELHKTR